jgi:uncharacterized protein
LLFPSVYNSAVPLGEGRHALFNFLAGSLDVVDDTVLSALTGGASAPALPEDVAAYLDARGYLWAEAGQEAAQAEMLYGELLSFHRKSLPQTVVVIPSYHCNLSCGYCWQRLYDLDSPVIRPEMGDRFFQSLPQVVEGFPGRGVEIIVFGGEPLAADAELKQRVVQILDTARGSGYQTKVITNGVGLEAAAEDLAGKVDTIQVTIDGPPEFHRRRRPIPGGDSYEPLRRGVDAAIRAGLRVNVRVNVDFQNVSLLPELSDHIREQGWLGSGLVTLFVAPLKNHNPRKTVAPETLLLREVLELAARDERMNVFCFEGFAGIKYFKGFVQTGMLPLQRFFNCEAQMNFYAFDPRGDIYACWDAAGIPEMAVGRYWPDVRIDAEKLAYWRGRSGLRIAGCHGCAALPACGGGCAFLAYEHKGRLTEPTCDSLLDAFKLAVAARADWVLERAQKGDHCVGLVTASGVNPVTRELGLFEDKAGVPSLRNSC